ncbi:MAG TPA: histidinol dehydrogenase [Acidimicrobiales bacterium]|nr:histidinol dehydrogenase [Acidimicrobiales bacterium]
MLRRIDLRGTGPAGLRDLPRPSAATPPPAEAVQAIIAEVRAGGDAAVRDCTERFDKVRIDELRVPAAEIDAALAGLTPELRAALDTALANITDYHRGQVTAERTHERDGITVRELRRPVQRAGCYVPGGLAPLISTVLMTAVPAWVAGVEEIVLCTPPGPDGTVAPALLAAAALAGVDEVYRVGGAQAIAALAYGTESIRPVDVIVGPGNLWVAQAKREVAASGQVGVPSSFPGPSEVVVVADDSVAAEYAAVDLMVQVEHGPDGLAWLITWLPDVADRIEEAVAKLLTDADRRDVITANLEANGYVALVDDAAHAVDVANAIAPEHLQLMVAGADDLLERVRNAGAVFCGPWAPASVGDYLAGPNHVLPTDGTARFAGALRVDDFVKHVHVVSMDEAALARVAPDVAILAEAEGLTTHARSVRIRGEQ